MKKSISTILTALLFLTACLPASASTNTSTTLYDYCAITPSSNLVDQSAAGTPIPPEEVKIVTQGDLETLKNMDFEIITPYSVSEGHVAVVFAPVGFTDGGSDEVITMLTEGLRNNFTEADLDFAYVDRSVPIGINLLQYSSNFVNWDEYHAFKDRVDSRVDHAIIVFVINAKDGFASASGSEITISVNTTDIDLVIAHEMGHIFGLDDGYPSYRNPDSLPNGELWFADNQPEFLKEAAAKVENPPVYEVGTCNGKTLYSYYDPNYNIMWSQMHHSGQPWGSIFTPIQKEIINQNIALMLGK